MTYSLSIKRNNGTTLYVNDLKSWKDVTDYLKTKLTQLDVKVIIFKISSDNRTLGEKVVTMSNMWQVLNSPNDKILI